MVLTLAQVDVVVVVVQVDVVVVVGADSSMDHTRGNRCLWWPGTG